MKIGDRGEVKSVIGPRQGGEPKRNLFHLLIVARYLRYPKNPAKDIRVIPIPMRVTVFALVRLRDGFCGSTRWSTPTGEGMGEIPKPDKLISVATPATVPSSVETNIVGDGREDPAPTGEGKVGGTGVGEGLGICVGLGESEGDGEGVGVGILTFKLIARVFDSPALLVELPVKRRIFRSYIPGPK